MAEIKKEMRVEGEKLTAASAGIRESSRALRNCITAHQKLMIDVGTLLRTISKSEDYDIPEIANYLSTYKVFSERVSSIINATMVDGGGVGGGDRDCERGIPFLSLFSSCVALLWFGFLRWPFRSRC